VQPNGTLKAKKKHGCLFYGCLSAVILAILTAVGVWFAVMKVKNLAMAYTSDRPADIPVVVLPPEKMADLNARLQAFQQAMRGDQPARLVLTADEISAELNSDGGFRKMGGRANVRIDADQISAALSIPTDSFGLKGRYLNGTAKIRVGLQAGRLLVFVDQIEVAGKTPPEAFMKGIRAKNLAENAMQNPDAAAVISKLKKITVQDGVVILEK